MKLLPFNFGKKDNGKALMNTAPNPIVPHGSGTVSSQDLTRGITMQYLMGTLAVLKNENIPLAKPVNGTPARGAKFVEIPFNLDRDRIGPRAMRSLTSLATLEAIQVAARVNAVIARQEQDQIIFQYQLDSRYWQKYTRADLSKPDGIGLGVGRRLVPLRLDSHIMVGGMTRSGKSVTVETAIFSIMAAYSPEQAGAVLVDPHYTFGIRKLGLETNKIGEFTNAAHLLRPVAHTSEQIGQAIDFVYAEWKYRKANNIQDAPAIILVIDELLDEAVLGEQVGSRYTHEGRLRKLTQLASGGLKNNVFLIIGAQDPKISNTDAMLMRNLGRRYIGRCADGAASRNMTGRDDAGANFLTEKGDFLEIGPDAEDGSHFRVRSRFQVAEPTRADFDRLVRRPIEARPVVQNANLIEVDDNTSSQDGNGALDILAVIEEEMTAVVNRGGRPEVQFDPYTLALYLLYRDQLSMNAAANNYGILRRTHEKHRGWAYDVIEEVNRLKEGLPPRSIYYQKWLEKRQKEGSNGPGN